MSEPSHATETQSSLTAEAYYTKDIKTLDDRAKNIRKTAASADTTFFAREGNHTGLEEYTWEMTEDQCEQELKQVYQQLDKLETAQASHADKLQQVQQTVSRRSMYQTKSCASVRGHLGVLHVDTLADCRRSGDISRIQSGYEHLYPIPVYIRAGNEVTST